MKKETKQKFIYTRYILPPLLIFALFPLSFIPSYRYVVSGDVRKPISLATLITNSWSESRATLFGDAARQTNGVLLFSRIMLILIITFAVLYIIAFTISLWSSAVALKLFISDDRAGAENMRTLFITFLPNRIILIISECLAIPICIFPYIVPVVYYSTLLTKVRVSLCAPDTLIFSIIFFTTLSIFSAYTAKFERRFDVDIFEKHVPFESTNNKPENLIIQNGAENQKRNLSDEEAELIRKLLNKNNDDNKQN